MLKESGNPEQRSLADVVEALTELRGAVISIDKRINSPEGLIAPEFLEKYFIKMRKMSSEFTTLPKEIIFEIRDVTEELKELLTISRLTEKDIHKIKNVIERVRKVGILIEEINFRTAKNIY